MDETKHDRWYRLIPKQLKLLKEKLVKCPSQLLPRLSASSPYSCSRVTCRNVTNFSVNNFGCSSINCQQLSSSSSSNYNNDISVYWWSRRHQTKPQTVHSPSQQQLQQRYISLLVKPETSNKTSDRAIAVAAATTWNRLPLKVRTATSTEQFSHALKTHLFTLDWSRGSPRRLWLVISTDELWRRIQTEWLIELCSREQWTHLAQWRTIIRYAAVAVDINLRRTFTALDVWNWKHNNQN